MEIIDNRQSSLIEDCDIGAVIELEDKNIYIVLDTDSFCGYFENALMNDSDCFLLNVSNGTIKVVSIYTRCEIVEAILTIE